MKLSRWRILEIAKLTRRQMFQVAGAAGVGAVLPSCAMPGRVSGIRQEGMRPVLDRLRTDQKFRSLALRDHEKVLAGLDLTPAEKDLVKERLRLVNLVTTALAFQLMKDQKPLRPVLLSPSKRYRLLFGDEVSVHDESLSIQDASKVANLKLVLDAIVDEIMAIPPDQGLVVVDVPSDEASDEDVDFVCEYDGGCENRGCTDSGCSDWACTNGGCTHLGCNDDGCDNGSCTNEACEHDDCDDECTDGAGWCPSDDEDFLPDSLFEELASRFEEALDRGPEMGFLVRVGGRTLRSESFLDYGLLKNTLQTLDKPRSWKKRSGK